MVSACPCKVQLTSSPPPDTLESMLVPRVVREMVTRERVVEETEHEGQTGNFDEESDYYILYNLYVAQP